MREAGRIGRGWLSGICRALLFGVAFTAACEGGNGGSTAGVPLAGFGAACTNDSDCQGDTVRRWIARGAKND